jgi:superfamily II DNA or RNA helicase
MNVEDFYVTYPSLSDPFFESDLVSNKEFRELKLSASEERPVQGTYLKYQQIIQRYLSEYTLYDGVLLYNEVGTGKTCTTVAVIEHLRKHRTHFRKAVIIASDALLDNYKNELAFRCTKDVYVPDNYDLLTDKEKTIRLNKKVGSFYEFYTYYAFAKRVRDARPSEFDKCIFVIDEVHNLRPSKESDTYEVIHTYLHTVSTKKVMLLSATPMTDSAFEIVYPMNLILPLAQQLPLIEAEFNAVSLEPYLRGRVSYLKATRSANVTKEFIGDRKVGNFTVEECPMKSTQLTAYKQAYEIDSRGGEGTGIWSNTRQASLFVFPDGSYGSTGFDTYVEKRKVMIGDTQKSVFVPKKAFLNAFAGDVLKTLQELSSKYFSILSNITSGDKKNHFVYLDLVTGSGAIVFSFLLEMLGYKRANGTEKKPGKRYAIINNETATTAQIRDIKELFNSEKNKNGEYIQVVIGSDVIVEGISLYNVQEIYIGTPFWNYAKIEQAIGRAIRAFSHDALGRNVTVRIHQYASVPDKGTSIDVEMYRTSSEKDTRIKQVERTIQINSFDCLLTKERNMLPSSFDKTRECQYTSCEYTCVNEVSRPLRTANYDTVYFDTTEYTPTIMRLLSDKGTITLRELQEGMSDLSIRNLLDTIHEMIQQRTVVTLRNGLKGYVRMEGEKVYVDERLTRSSHFMGSYLISPYMHPNRTFDNVQQKLTAEYIQNLDDDMSYDDVYAILDVFPADLQRTFLENALLAESKGIETQTVLRENILRYFADDYSIENEEYSYKYKGVEKCLVDGRWTACEDREGEQQRDVLEANPYGVYGILKDDTFRVKQTGQKIAKDVGKVCSFYTLEALMDFILRIDDSPEPTIPKSKEHYLKIVLEKKIPYTEEETRSFSHEKVYKMYLISKMSKTERCDRLKDLLILKNLVLYV